MLNNYLKIAWRNLWQNKLFSLINVCGLIAGLVSVMLILVYVRYELSYDRHVGDAEKVYRMIMVNQQFEGELWGKRISVPAGVGSALKKEFPEVKEIVHLTRPHTQWIINGKVYDLDAKGASATFFKVFDFKLLKGGGDALTEPQTAVISEGTAKKMFGNADPLGKTITSDRLGEMYRITGVMENIPPNTHFSADIIISLEGDTALKQALNIQGGYTTTIQYVLLEDQASVAGLRVKLPAFYQKYGFRKKESIEFQPLTSIHLHSNLNYELAPNGDIRYVYIFSVAALLVLVVACINFVNLTTAKSLRRAKEVGLRKVMGAGRAGLALQFLSEALILFCFSLICAILIAHLLLPFFARRLDIPLALADFLDVQSVGLFAGIALLAGTIAGLYPALFLSAQKPVLALKGVTKLPVVNIQFRKLLVIAQFVVSVGLIASTLIIYLQMQFISHKRLGFDKELLVYLPEYDYQGKTESFKNELLRHSGISNVSISEWDPGVTIGPTGSWTDDSDSTKVITFDYLFADFDFFETLALKMDAGRVFSSEYGADMVNIDSILGKTDDWGVLENWSIILNETAVKRLGIKDPVGRRLYYPGLQGTVVGVVKDFNALSLHEAVTPMVLKSSPDISKGNAYIRLHSGNIETALTHIQKTWEKFFPEKDFKFSFVDDMLESLYTAEKRMSRLFLSFAVLGVGVSCLGLFGLALFEVQQRSKEIGIRKVLGASVASVVTLLSKDFIKLVGIATILAIPVAWYFMNRWLEDFAYRIVLSGWMFALAGFLAVAVALLTVSFQAIKAALSNPMATLRSE